MTFLSVRGQKSLKMHKESQNCLAVHQISNPGREEWLLCHPVACRAKDTLSFWLRPLDFRCQVPFSNLAFDVSLVLMVPSNQTQPTGAHVYGLPYHVDK